MQVFGRFRGEIEVTGRFMMGEGAKVDAHIVADAAEIGGELKGEIKVRSLVLLEKSRIEGNVDTQVLNIREGAQLNGAVNTGCHGRVQARSRPGPAVDAARAKPEEAKAG